MNIIYCTLQFTSSEITYYYSAYKNQMIGISDSSLHFLDQYNKDLSFETWKLNKDLSSSAEK